MQTKFLSYTIKHLLLAIKHQKPHGCRLLPLTRIIKELIILGGFTILSTSAWAKALINPNEIWLDPGRDKGLCFNDIDNDGDLDAFKIYPGVVTKLENTGTPEFPTFTFERAFSNDTGILNLNRLGLFDCRYYSNSVEETGETSVSIDIDADGDLDLDLDLFTVSHQKSLTGQLNYFRNDGTTDHPNYVKDNTTRLGLPLEAGNFMFRDIDHDGDEDFFESFSSVFYENIGTAENAVFINRPGGGGGSHLVKILDLLLI